ncbi:hypothetical protein DICSQDRAFT_130961 [Dichomitus squalens LYAD-421 SS1]|uniref:Uncharacterized protein n=1 Tax=Dichomitus squalens TaxID=114155 RepID=A0A4Q9N5I1_9APHY|nr:uncharacterized protein DICSQDRAFT_130961 [Dichomitus squalens LYAD-421 SS1]EJF66708.1 hypothetical protein DICSQDRAFT_130961 [Dichomitus squalens LYAD-421 SS1]TBU35258.1 hypothetical protein BD311DRAFT_649392 [Dichomitus squalens]
MMSVMPPSVHLQVHLDANRPTKDVEFNELGNLNEAVEPFAQLIKKSGHSVRLHCTIPTGFHSSPTCADLHDLHDLRTRSLMFVHNLVESLRASGIPASYRLQPANCSMCLICALPSGLDASKVRAAAFAAVQNAKLDLKEKALLADLSDGYALVLT